MDQRWSQLPEEMGDLPDEHGDGSEGARGADSQKGDGGADNTAGTFMVVGGVVLRHEFADCRLQAEF